MMKIVRLNVGGAKYETTYETLVREPLSKLALLVHEKEPLRLPVVKVEDGEGEKVVEEAEAEEAPEKETPEEDETPEKETAQERETQEEMQAEVELANEETQEIFIDRNGNLFEFVLEYLRNPNDVKLPHDSHLILERLMLEANYFQLEGLKRHVEYSLNTFPFGVDDTVRLRPDVVGRWINNVVDKNDSKLFLYACGLEHVEFPENSWNPFRKKNPSEVFWSLFSRKRSPAEIYAWRGRITSFVGDPIPDYAVVRFRLPQYSKRKEDPDYVDMDLRVQIGMMVKVK